MSMRNDMSVRQVAYANGRVEVAMSSTLYTAAQRGIIWVDGQYYGETYADASYYSTIAKSAGTVTVSPVGAVSAGARVQIAIIAGAPGDQPVPDPDSVPLILDTQAAPTPES